MNLNDGISLIFTTSLLIAIVLSVVFALLSYRNNLVNKAFHWELEEIRKDLENSGERLDNIPSYMKMVFHPRYWNRWTLESWQRYFTERSKEFK